MAERLKVLVTGTEGRVGRAILPGLVERFDITKFDIALPDEDVDTGGFRGDIVDYAAVKHAVHRVRPACILHLAANADQDAFAGDLYLQNFTGVNNVYNAAVASHVPKIVLASSLHTLSGHPGFPNQSPFPDGRKFSPADETNPGNPYGESKAWAERTAQQYARDYGLRTVVLRFGDLSSDNQPASGPHERFAPIWLSHGDATQVVTRAITAQCANPVEIFFATSDNGGPYDIGPTIERLGYAPQDGLAKSKF